MVLVYECEYKAIGVAIFSQVNPGVWELRDIAIHPAFQSRGIGASLLTEVISCIRKLRGKRVFLSVRALNDPAVSLYEKLGFEVYDVAYTMKLEL
jgi:ribosomal-protein-alanine N-acetyltransferase